MSEYRDMKLNERLQEGDMVLWANCVPGDHMNNGGWRTLKNGDHRIGKRCQDTSTYNLSFRRPLRNAAAINSTP
jgi:hypothetical protein